jgi:hypothetical protein
VFNVVERGLNTLQSEVVPQVAGYKGKSHIGALTSAEGGSLVTLIACMSTECVFVPHMLIFPRTNMGDQLIRGAPQGVSGTFHPSGWVQPHLFTDRFHHLTEKINNLMNCISYLSCVAISAIRKIWN